jgi:hypothetical protein
MAFVSVTWAYQEVVSSSKLQQMADNDEWLKDQVEALAGVSGITTAGSYASASASEVAITGCTVTFTADGVSSYEILWTGHVQCSVANDRLGIRIKRGATTAGDAVFILPFIGVGVASATRIVDAPPAGSVTYQAVVLLSGGTGTATVPVAATKPAILTARKI